MKHRDNMPDRQKFFAEIYRQISDLRLQLAVEFAYNFAKEAHRNQTRDSGERYFNHCKAVAWVFLTEVNMQSQHLLATIVIMALLHDLLEDTFVAKKQHLHFIFDQIDPAITEVIDEVTKDQHHNFDKLLRSNRLGTKLVKAADRLHNLRTLPACREEKRNRKIQETEETILPWLMSDPCQITMNDPLKLLVRNIESELKKLHTNEPPT